MSASKQCGGAAAVPELRVDAVARRANFCEIRF